MIRIKSFVIERAIDFFTDFRRGISQEVLLMLFSRLLSHVVSMTVIGYRNLSVLCTSSSIYMSRTSYFYMFFFFFNLRNGEKK